MSQELITAPLRRQIACFQQRFEAALAEAKTPESAKALLNETASFERIAKQIKAGVEVQRPIARMVLKAKGNYGLAIGRKKPYPGSKEEEPSSLPEPGFAKAALAAFRKIGDHYELIDPFCDRYESNDADVPSQAGFLNEVKAKADKSTKKPKKTKTYKVEIRKGDFAVVLDDVRDIDAIITDPPYGREFLGEWKKLAAFAATHLNENGVLVSYCGQMFLPTVLEILSAELDYWWCLACVNSGPGKMSPLGHPVRKVLIKWKPVLFFARRGSVFERSFQDLVPSERPDKSGHNWAQPVSEASWLIEQFTSSGNLIVDPFAGSGTVGEAARITGRRFIGADLL